MRCVRRSTTPITLNGSRKMRYVVGTCEIARYTAVGMPVMTRSMPALPMPLILFSM